jgi:hypothetical protein
MIEILAVQTARVILHFRTAELNPAGLAILPDITTALVERYGFITYPQKAEDYDEQKGVSYEIGKWNDRAIGRLALYDTGLLVDTGSSTDDSEAILRDALTWASETFGLAFRAEWFNRRVYLSELIVKCEKPLTALNPALATLAAKLSKRVSEIMDLTLPYEVTALSFGFDPFLTKNAMAGFRIDRLADVRFSENRYYAVANLPTEEHIEYLKEFEAALAPPALPL